MTDMEETFYDSLSISFEHSVKSAIYLFDERSDTITTEETSFTSIDYTRNTDLSNNNELIGFGETTLFEDFIIYSDPFNVIYEADIDMDGKRDYKHVIDVDQNGKVDIIRFGVESGENSEIVIWHTIIQDFEGEEQFYHSQEGAKQRTEWFDIRDDIFADNNFQLDDLLVLIFFSRIAPYRIPAIFNVLA
ncbi:unnamed protein product [marine sediment metagenome]|uniref:Uncharacterized protein n=1 Tax=marine sediment metagenome TaxID=412755 RepID=X1L1I3_9ZZZZ